MQTMIRRPDLDAPMLLMCCPKCFHHMKGAPRPL